MTLYKKDEFSFSARICAALLIIFYLVGIPGVIFRPVMFVPFSPALLAFTSVLLFLNGNYRNPDFIRFCILVTVAGFAIELMGVRTGKIFGHYIYGYALGWQLKGVPMVIGFNWLLLTLSTLSLSVRVSSNPLIASVTGALLMVLLDMLIEQVAPAYHFWYWQDNVVPLKNYIAWFIISFLFHFTAHQIRFYHKNPLDAIVYFLQVLFFASLNIVRLMH